MTTRLMIIDSTGTPAWHHKAFVIGGILILEPAFGPSVYMHSEVYCFFGYTYWYVYKS
jgi:hypothetical protein